MFSFNTAYYIYCWYVNMSFSQQMSYSVRSVPYAHPSICYTAIASAVVATKPVSSVYVIYFINRHLMN